MVRGIVKEVEVGELYEGKVKKIMDFGAFVLASALSRSARFFLVAGLIGALYRKYGDRVTDFINQRFNILAVSFFVLLVGGFLIIRAF
ncbi:MAG: hypothetical protein IIB00_07320 [candidate division Zixibacteria bacterium]|nr:hypothetical protein [candidate division Zixibacteria bacterium]